MLAAVILIATGVCVLSWATCVHAGRIARMDKRLADHSATLVRHATAVEKLRKVA